MPPSDRKWREIEIIIPSPHHAGMGGGHVKVNNVHYKTYAELINALRKEGVESLQSAIFIDFSKSNQWTGQQTYGYQLHDIAQPVTPYEHVLRTLAPVFKDFDDDDIYPVYRFGCTVTRDTTVVPLTYPQNNNEHINGMDAVCTAYRTMVPLIQLAGPTTIAPCIQKGIDICRAYQQQNVKQHLVLVIVTDGDVSDFERDKKAVCDASHYPISICAIGVGDGPFDKMDGFDRFRKGRLFDNFHFCNFTKFLRTHAKDENPELSLATQVFTEVAAQSRALKALKLL